MSSIPSETIPLPKSRGARLQSTTTRLPTSASGAYAAAIPGTIRRGAASPVSIRRSRSLSFFFTRSAATTTPTRRSSLAKSSYAIRRPWARAPAVATAAVVAGAAGAAGAVGAGVNCCDDLGLPLLLEAGEDGVASLHGQAVRPVGQREGPEGLGLLGQRLPVEEGEAELRAQLVRDLGHHGRDEHAHRLEHVEQRPHDGPEPGEVALLLGGPGRGPVDVLVGPREEGPERGERRRRVELVEGVGDRLRATG